MREDNTMTTLTLAKNFVREYKNNGQHLEQLFRYSLTGERVKADNIKADKGTDFAQYSIKSARATICKGRDLAKHLATDKATEFVYITKTEIAYIMSKAEYIEFVAEFGTVTRESQKNGGYEKTRLGHETKALIEWLEQRA